MSCNWYLVCPKHGVKVDFWRYQAGGIMYPSVTARENPDEIDYFLLEHSKCGIVVANDEELFDHLPDCGFHEFVSIEAFECKHCKLRAFADSKEVKKLNG